jgi:hypothetical protein
MSSYPPSLCLPGIRPLTFLTSDPNLHSQFRMHASKGVDVHVSAAAKLVIEGCTGIYFSEYPANSPVSGGTNNVSYRIPWETCVCRLTRTEWVYHRFFGSRIFLTYGKRRRRTGLSGMILRSRSTIGSRNSGTAAQVRVSGTYGCLTKSWLVSAAKDLSEYAKGIIS